MKKHVTILFWLFKSRMNDAGQCTIMCRLSLQGKRAEISTSEYAKAPAKDKAKAGEWDSEMQSE